MIYRTTDIVLAATLKCRGNVLEKIDIDGKRGIFHFSGVDTEFLDSFNTGKVMVEPCAFHSEVRSLTQALSRMKGV
jgi:hypothetical protein